MPKRVIDGEALWTSIKLANVKRKYQAEYADLIPLALASGTFVCEPKLIWRDAYSYARKHITEEIVTEILDGFEANKMLFRWQEGGRTYGFWVGITNEPGRLPKPSDKRHDKRGPEVPLELLNHFLGTEWRPDNQQFYRRA